MDESNDIIEFHVYEGSKETPSAVLERYFAKWERSEDLYERYEWSEGFWTSPVFGCSPRERHQHILNARALDLSTCKSNRLRICKELDQKIHELTPHLWMIIVDFVPYERNLIPAHNISTPAKTSVKTNVKNVTDHHSMSFPWPLDKRATDRYPWKRVCVAVQAALHVTVGDQDVPQFTFAELINSHNFGNEGYILLSNGTIPVRLPSHRFVSPKHVYYDSELNLVWVHEHCGDIPSWTWQASGLKFGLDPVTGHVRKTLPFYHSDNLELEHYFNSSSDGGGQLFIHSQCKKNRNCVKYGNLDLPFGLYFADSFSPPRLQMPLEKLENRIKNYGDDHVLLNGILYTFMHTFGTP